MERILERLASKLNDLDEASLMALWEKYQHKVKDFEPTRRWEISVLVWGLIQSVHWKNQLFNVKFVQLQNPEQVNNDNLPMPEQVEDLVWPVEGSGSKKGAKIIPFSPGEEG